MDKQNQEEQVTVSTRCANVLEALDEVMVEFDEKLASLTTMRFKLEHGSELKEIKVERDY